MASAEADSLNLRRRVLFITHEHTSPGDRRVRQEAATLADKGYIVSILCPKEDIRDNSLDRHQNIRIYRYPAGIKAASAIGSMMSNCITLVWQFMLAGRVFLTRGFDVIHLCNPPDGAVIICGFFKLFFLKKFLFDFRMSMPEAHAAKASDKSTSHAGLLRLEHNALTVSDVVIVANGSLKELAIRRHQVAVQKIVVVGEAIDTGALKKIMPPAALREGRALLVSCTSSIDPSKGLPYFFEAARIVLQDKRRRDVTFIVTETVAVSAATKKLAALQGISDAVRFSSGLSHSLTEIFAGCDLCVHCDEADAATDKVSSAAVLECMGLARPVIQFDRVEARAQAGDASLYAKANDAQDLAEKILSLLDDPKKRNAMGAFGRRRVETELAWSFAAPTLMAVYDRLFAASGDR